MSESYSEKVMRITITIDSGGGKAESLIFTDYAMSCRITKQGAPELPKASVSIYGLSEAQMSHLTLLSFDSLSLRRNVIEIAAGEKGKELAIVFQGEIMNAAPDMNAMPSPVMQLEAITAAYPKLIPLSPVAVKGSQTVNDLAKTFAQEAGLTYEGHGVTGSVKDCVISGDPITKLEKLAEMAGVDMVVDDMQVNFIAPNAAKKEAVPLSMAEIINPWTGQIGYPSFDSMGVRVTCFFRPDLQVAGLMRIQSGMPRATGLWKIYSVSHELSVNQPGGGAWRTVASGTWMEK